MAAYFHCDHHAWREVIDSHLRMARKNTDKLMDTRAESKMSLGPQSCGGKSDIFQATHSTAVSYAPETSCMALQVRHRYCI